MSRVADYSIVEDKKLAVSGVVSRDFQVPPNVNPGSSGIVSFVVTRTDDVEDGSLSIKINGVSVYNATYSADFGLDRGVQEVFGPDILKSGKNQMEINMNPGGGTVEISDIVVWFQANSNIIGGGNQHGTLVLRRDDDKDRIRLDAGTADLRMGGGGTNGDIMLFPSTIGIADVPYPPEMAVIHLGAKEATLRMGKADLPGEKGEKAGKILLRGGPAPGSTRIHLNAGTADILVGGNGASGDVYLFPDTAGQQSSNQATIRLNGDTGEITASLFTPNADCAEDFEVADVDAAEAGTVMVIGDDSRLTISDHAYDKRVAGVIAGAGDRRPGIILGRRKASDSHAVPIALLGRVFCKADAAQGRIAVGDLLTSSSVAGHAMKASDPVHAFGAVLGKALGALESGRGLIPVLVALQ
jgi:hypothetical protein